MKAELGGVRSRRGETSIRHLAAQATARPMAVSCRLNSAFIWSIQTYMNVFQNVLDSRYLFELTANELIEIYVRSPDPDFGMPRRGNN